MSSKASWALGAMVVVASFAAGMWLSASRSGGGDAAAVDGLLWPDPPALASFELIDHEGRPLRPADLRGRWSLIFFGFTHCPDVCPTALAAMAAAQAELREHPHYGERGQLVFISVDPMRDDAERIADYVAYFAPDFVGATAATPELEKLTRSLGALFMQIPLGDGGYTVDHSAGIFFISPDLHLVSVLTPPQTATDIVRRFDAVSRFVAERG